MTQRPVGRSIVVGIDGSEASMAALRWATRQARPLSVKVVAVPAREPNGPGPTSYAPVSARPPTAEQRARAAQLLTGTLHKVCGPRIDRGVRASSWRGHPRTCCCTAPRGALLPALGLTVHRQGGLASIGSVGHECLRHAAVPVGAVPATNSFVALLRAGRTRSLATVRGT
jgi:nucleotide-binding universal stress UspA family protein